MTATELPSIDMSFELIRSKFHDPEFLNCRGLGGEVPLYIYPYAARQEDQVRSSDSAAMWMIAHTSARQKRLP